MSEPDHGLMGTSSEFENFSEPSISEADLKQEKQMAKYRQSDEFKKIQDYCETRIEFYQKCLPGGKHVGLDGVPNDVAWQVANLVITELELLINMYETAAEAVKDAKSEELPA